MSDPHDTKSPGATPAAAIPFHEASDHFIACCLGRDLQGATLRVALYLVVACVVFATIAALVG